MICVAFIGRHDILVVRHVPGKKTHRSGARFFVLTESDTGYNVNPLKRKQECMKTHDILDNFFIRTS